MRHRASRHAAAAESIEGTVMKKMPRTLRRSTLAAALALASVSALAAGDVASLAYAGGEALPPEAESRLVALTTAPGGVLTREEVRQQWAQARQDGTLSEAGEEAEPPRVLMARSAANDRQAQAIVAAQQAEQARLAALEAEAEARRLAQAQATSTLAQAPSSTAGTPAADAGTLTDAVAPAADTAAPVAEAATSPDAPADRPFERPPAPPAMAPLEVPITRPLDAVPESLVDKD
jgi:hypothetical protein